MTSFIKTFFLNFRKWSLELGERYYQFVCCNYAVTAIDEDRRSK